MQDEPVPHSRVKVTHTGCNKDVDHSDIGHSVTETVEDVNVSFFKLK